MARRLHLVAYDVRSPKRWRRLYALMRRRGAHRQLSVFLVRAEAAAIRRLAEDIRDIVDAGADSVLIVPVDEAAASRLIEIGAPGPMPGPEVVVI